MGSLLARARRLQPRTKTLILGGLGLAGVAALIVVGPIDRSTYVDNFADRRVFLGIPNFWNVVSNLPFAIVGWLGLRALQREPAPLRPALACLYLGIFLTAVGSAYHHLAPSYDRLLFDRLPMTLAFAAVFAVALGDRVGARQARVALVPLIAIAAASALYWYFSGQLRPYVFVQGYPMVAIPALLLLYPGTHLDGRHFFAAVGLYAIAKGFERFDLETYQLGQLLSGHSVKHLFAGWASWHLVAMVSRAPRRAA